MLKNFKFQNLETIKSRKFRGRILKCWKIWQVVFQKIIWTVANILLEMWEIITTLRGSLTGPVLDVLSNDH
jgi:hypothetical protein